MLEINNYNNSTIVNLEIIVIFAFRKKTFTKTFPLLKCRNLLQGEMIQMNAPPQKEVYSLYLTLYGLRQPK